MGSPEGFGKVSFVGEVRLSAEGACSSGSRKDDVHTLNVSAPPLWRNLSVAQHCMDVSQPSSVNERNLGDLKSHPPALDIDVNLLIQKSGKVDRRNGRCTKMLSGTPQVENSKCKPGLHAVHGISEVVASSSASRGASEKNQLVKQKNSSTSRRGEKRNSKVKHMNRCGSFSLKNGLVGFNSAAGGNNFFGAYGLKPDVFDITKYVNELPLHELLRGSDTSPCTAKEGNKASSLNHDLLQSFRKVCSVLQPKKVLPAQNYAEVDNSCIHRLSTGFITVNSLAVQPDGEKGFNHTAELLNTNQVLETDEKIKMSSIAESPLFTPKEMLERLALPPPKDLDLLLSDATKTTPSSKSNADLRLSKQVHHRGGMPPFPWSHSFSGHSKLGSDTPRSSTSRSICHGRWVKVEISSAHQNDLANLLLDFESLSFDQNLVPPSNLTCEQANKFAPMERDVPADESPSTRAAAETLLHMAAFAKENPCSMVKLSKKPSQINMKASKLKAIKRPNIFDTPNSSIRHPSSLRVGDYGFSSKKLRLSSDVTNSDTMRKGRSQQTPLLCFRSPPRKLSRDSNACVEENGANLVKKQCVMKTSMGRDRPGGNKTKIWKPSP